MGVPWSPWFGKVSTLSKMPVVCSVITILMLLFLALFEETLVSKPTETFATLLIPSILQKKEAAFWFPDDKLVQWDPVAMSWLYEETPVIQENGKEDLEPTAKQGSEAGPRKKRSHFVDCPF